MSYELFQQGPAAYIPVILVSLVVTVVAYGAFPFVFARARKKVITKKKYNRLCYGFNILVMIMFIALNGEPSSGGPYLLWTWVFSAAGIKTLERRDVLERGQPADYTKTSTEGTARQETNDGLQDDNPATPNHLDPIEVCLSDADETVKPCGTWNIMGSDLQLEKSDVAEVLETPTELEPQHQEHQIVSEKVEQGTLYTKYCSKCGKGIDPVTKICTGCGKQYFKGFSDKTLAVVGVLLLVVVIFIFGAWLNKLNVEIYSLNESLEEVNTTLTNAKNANAQLREDLQEARNKANLYRDKAEFLDDYVVMIEDDGTKLYHKYECDKFVGNGFWVYNTEAAESRGYRPCPECH